MILARRRLASIAGIALLVLLIGGGASLRAPAVSAQIPEAGPNAIDFEAGFITDESGTPIIRQPDDPLFSRSYNPPRLHAGDTSHPGVATAPTEANPALPLNGYCVYISSSTVEPSGGNLGFIATGIDPIDPDAQPEVAAALTTATTATDPLHPTNGDYYCAVVTAPAGYQTLRLDWQFTDPPNGISLPTIVTLNGDNADLIPIRTVTLVANPPVGGTVTVCTEGWDGTFMAGASQPNSINSLGVVTSADFVLSNTTDFDAPAVRPSGAEWCADISLKSSVAINASASTNVAFNFNAFYNYIGGAAPYRLVAHSVSLPESVTVKAEYALQHLGLDGQLLGQQLSPALVIGAPETACISRTSQAAGDTLNANNIQITPITSPPDKPNVSGLTVFYLNGTGPLCFTYTSTTPGEQAVTAMFSHAGTPTTATWNGQPLFVQWNRIDRTALTTGNVPADGEVTFTTITVPLAFNVATGTFLASGLNLSEWVIGSHDANGRLVTGFLQGAELIARIEGNCGYFVTPDNLTTHREITGMSVDGRFELDAAFGDTDANPDDLRISITNDTGCTAGSAIRVSVDVFYPGQTTPALPTEYVDYQFVFIPPNKTPVLAWAGQIVNVTYAVSGQKPCPGSVVFSRPDNQPGAFLATSGVSLNGPGSASASFAECTVTVMYSSADPGEVDVEASLLNADGSGNRFSKVGFPIFFMAIEDVSMSAPSTSVVSTVGNVSATVRGWFVGSNPSGREAEKKEDGRVVPKDRWVIPDDWERLRGNGDFRQNWGGPSMPPLNITLKMEDDSIVNDYHKGIKNGALGWFLDYDGPDEGQETNTEVGRIPDSQGVYPKPRTVTLVSDSGGSVTEDIFGDQNLSFEGCAANAASGGNPHCKEGDVVGHTKYYAVADYMRGAGKFPPVISNVAPTEWTWGGYKQVTIVPGEDPAMKYVVAHLKDRDGYCDASSWNNVLGIPVQFQIDSGDGMIVEAQGQPASISSGRRMAVATTFDTMDDLGNPINTEITKGPISDDECQAWILVSSTLLNPANVLVTFPAQPAPIPGNVKLTGLDCSTEVATVTNQGAAAVSLAGFALRSLPTSSAGPEEHLGLSGLLLPGQSAQFTAGVGAGADGWLNATSFVYTGGAKDYARLVWNNFELNRIYCDGLQSTPATPNPLPAEGEGELVIDTVVPFGMEQEVSLAEGWNLITAGTMTTKIEDAFAGHMDDLRGVYLWDFANNQWLHYIPGMPAETNGITAFEKSQIYWVAVKRPFTVTLLK